jgi:predicted PurR-regulated permease PerM
MKYQKFQVYFFIALLLIVLGLTYYIFRPYFGVLFLATVFGVIFLPIYDFLHDILKVRIKWRKGEVSRIIAAILTLIIFMLILLIPLTLISFQLVDEVRNLYVAITTQENLGAVNDLVQYVEKQIGLYFPDYSANIGQYLQQAVGWAAQNIGSFFQSVGNLLVGLLLSLLAFYYFLKDGHRLKKFFIKISPLPDKDDEKIINKMKTAINSVIRGSLLVAILQGLSTGIGFAIFGIPNATLWGSLAAVAALIPTFGTGLVLIPAIIYLLITGDILQAFGLTVWGATAVGLIDNLLGPHLMKRGIAIHPFIILLGVLGGLSFFGPVGFLVGPLIISLLYALLDIYSEIFKPAKK